MIFEGANQFWHSIVRVDRWEEGHGWKRWELAKAPQNCPEKLHEDDTNTRAVHAWVSLVCYVGYYKLGRKI